MTGTAPDPDFDKIIRRLETGDALLRRSGAERERRQELLACLAELKAGPATDSARVSAGTSAPHENAPPYLVINFIIGLFGLVSPPEEPDPVAREAKVAAAEIETELAKDEPDALAVARSAQRLVRIRDWLLGKSSTAADEFAKSFGKSLGTSAGLASVAAASGMLGPVSKVIDAAAHWLRVATG